MDLSIEIPKRVLQEFRRNQRILARQTSWALVRSLTAAGQKAVTGRGSYINRAWRASGLATRGAFPSAGYAITERPQVRDLQQGRTTRMVIGPRTRTNPQAGARAGRAVRLQQGGTRRPWQSEYLVVPLSGTRTGARGIPQSTLNRAFPIQRGGKLYLAVRMGRRGIRIVASLRKQVRVRNRFSAAFDRVGSIVAREAQRRWPEFYRRELRAAQYRGNLR